MATAFVQVKFLRFHGGFNAYPGDVRTVAADWAAKAIKAGIVAAVVAPPPPPPPKSENKPDVEG